MATAKSHKDAHGEFGQQFFDRANGNTLWEGGYLFIRVGEPGGEELDLCRQWRDRCYGLGDRSNNEGVFARLFSHVGRLFK